MAGVRLYQGTSQVVDMMAFHWEQCRCTSAVHPGVYEDSTSYDYDMAEMAEVSRPLLRGVVTSGDRADHDRTARVRESQNDAEKSWNASGKNC